MNNMESPCKNCTDRFVKHDPATNEILNCHTTCQKYLAYRNKLDIEMEKRKTDLLSKINDFDNYKRYTK